MRTSEPGVDGFRLKGQDREDRFVDPPERFAAHQPLKRLQTERVLAQCQRVFLTEMTLPQSGLRCGSKR